jgi:O-antigen/teichoic acid export membrane protein
MEREAMATGGAARADTTPTVTTGLPPASRRRAVLLNLTFSYVILALGIVQGFVLPPLYVAKLPVALYGAWLATGNVLAWIEVMDPGLSALLQQRVAFAYGRGDSSTVARVIGTGATVASIASLAPLACWPLDHLLIQFVRADPVFAADLTASFHLALVALSVTLLGYAANSISLGLQLAGSAGAVQSLATVAGIGTTVACLLGGHGLISIPAGTLGRALVMFGGNAWRVLRWCTTSLRVKPRFVYSELRQIAGMSAFTFVSRLGSAVLGNLDATLAAQVASPQAAAVLVLTGRAFDPVRLATDRVALAAAPGLTHLAGSGDLVRVESLVERMRRLIRWIPAIGIGCVTALNGAFVALWVGPKLFGGEPLTLVYAVVAAIGVTVALMNQLTYALGGIRESSMATLVEAIVRVPLAYGLGLRFGIIGIPVASAISMAAVRGWYLPWLWGRLVKGSPAKQLRRWAANVALGVGMGVVGLWASGVVNRGTSSWMRFTMSASIAGGLGLLLALTCDPELRRLITRRQGRRGREAAP